MKNTIIILVFSFGVNSLAANKCESFFSEAKTTVKMAKKVDNALTPVHKKLFKEHFKTIVEIAEAFEFSVEQVRSSQVFEALDVLNEVNHFQYVMLLEGKIIYIDDGSKSINPYSDKNWGELTNNEIGFLKLPNQLIELVGYGYVKVNGKTETFKYEDKSVEFLNKIAANPKTSELFKELVKDYNAEIQVLLFESSLSSKNIIEADISKAHVKDSKSDFIVLFLKDSNDMYFFSKKNIPEFGSRSYGLVHFESIGFTKNTRLKIHLEKDVIVELRPNFVSTYSKEHGEFHDQQVKVIYDSLDKIYAEAKEDNPEKPYYKVYAEFYKNYETEILELLHNEKLKVEDIYSPNLGIGILKKSKEMVYVLESPLEENSYVFSADGVFKLKDIDVQKYGSTVFMHKGYGIRIKQGVGFIKSLKEESFEMSSEEINTTGDLLELKLGL